MTQDEQLRRERQAMRTEIHQIVFDRLTTNMWAPGERLSIDGLARELNVSPTPVREALVSLELSGLITYRPQRGYVVAQPLDQDQIDELIDARLVVERAALSRAFRKNWQDLCDQLASAHDAHVRTAERIQRSDSLDYDLVRDYFDADTEFHRQFLTLAANEFLSSMHLSLAAHAHRMRHIWANGRDRLDLEETLEEHSQIATRVKERNHDGALEALQAHLENVGQRFTG
ncbi:GntR family transcriptional regulator [Ruania albidiflava]|uniref:GntR family transcriptional regulator n=1 Tax=Ruania albidiflava TaxID=366586 RepID=UPI0023F4F76B|nr:GntR family transcriptional regulator [Ruania albidiflava]